MLLPRKKDSRKGDFGHVLVIAGSKGMTGAAVLCSLGAIRSGAGLVTAAIPQSQHQIVASRIHPEIMTLALNDNGAGYFNSKAFPVIKDFIRKRKITSLVIGPGIGCNDDTYQLVKDIINEANIPVVLDADALNVFSRETQGSAVRSIKQSKAEIIVTPHPGEMSRLTGLSNEKIQENRARIAQKFAEDNKVICVLKGHKTVISEGSEIFINTTGNPGMATAGCGDVLSGMIAAFIPQVRKPQVLNAALLAVYLHGLAGDIAAKQWTEISLIAGDIVQSIPQALITTESKRVRE